MSSPAMPLTVTVPSDGSVQLCWPADAAESVSVLFVRTGLRPGFMRWRLQGGLGRYTVSGLSRQQRYLCAVVGHAAAKSELAESAWVSVLPNAETFGQTAAQTASLPVVATRLRDFAAQVQSLRVMPQSRRMTVYFKLSPGFCEQVVIEVLRSGAPIARLSVEPEVTQLVLDEARVGGLRDGEVYEVNVSAVFGGVASAPRAVACVMAAQGEERRANAALPRDGVVYPCVEFGDELDPFAEQTGAAQGAREIICVHCRKAVRWRDYRLMCAGCSAEFVPNGRGAYLDVAALRFGTCRCCMPKKVLVQDGADHALACVASRKEYVRLPGEATYRLIEDLPLGLCHCCRPRRALVQVGQEVRCATSRELHRPTGGNGFALVPQAPVFDAAAIDELLDAGLAEIGARGVSRAR